MATTAQLELLEVEDVRDGLMVRLHADAIDETNACNLAEDLFDVAFHRGGPRLYLDLADVQQIADHVLLRLVVLHRRLQDIGDRLILLHPQPTVHADLLISRVSDLLDIRTG